MKRFQLPFFESPIKTVVQLFSNNRPAGLSSEIFSSKNIIAKSSPLTENFSVLAPEIQGNE